MSATQKKILSRRLARYRNLFCPFYDECLDHYAVKDAEQYEFDCFDCKNRNIRQLPTLTYGVQEERYATRSRSSSSGAG